MAETVFVIFIITIVIIILISIPWLYQPTEGYGEWSSVRISRCRRNSSSCLDGGTSVESEVCFPNPTTGRGCLNNGRQVYGTRITNKDCPVRCLKSKWQVIERTNCSSEGFRYSYLQCQAGPDDIGLECLDQGKIYSIGDIIIRQFPCINSQSSQSSQSRSVQKKDTKIRVSRDCPGGELDYFKESSFVRDNKIYPCRYLPNTDHELFGVPLTLKTFDNQYWSTKLPFRGELTGQCLGPEHQLADVPLVADPTNPVTVIIGPRRIHRYHQQEILIEGIVAILIGNGYQGFLVKSGNRLKWRQAQTEVDGPGINSDQASLFIILISQDKKVISLLEAGSGDYYYLHNHDHHQFIISS